WTLAMFSGNIAAALIVWLLRTRDRLVVTGLALVIGGALGNTLDRIHHGAVTDFLDFHLADWHWPAFNMADVGVVCGAAFLMLDSFVRQDRDAALAYIRKKPCPLILSRVHDATLRTRHLSRLCRLVRSGSR